MPRRRAAKRGSATHVTRDPKAAKLDSDVARDTEAATCGHDGVARDTVAATSDACSSGSHDESGINSFLQSKRSKSYCDSFR